MSAERLFAILGLWVFVFWMLGTIGVGDFVLKFSFYDEITCTKGIAP